jgi:isocitrate dehydrogenase
MQSSYNGIAVPKDGAAIQYANGKYSVPDNPIIPFIEGDGTGRDIWKASQRVFDAAVEKAYGGKRSVKWFEVRARRPTGRRRTGFRMTRSRRRWIFVCRSRGR